jgi:hypothetical protein
MFQQCGDWLVDKEGWMRPRVLIDSEFLIYIEFQYLHNACHVRNITDDYVYGTEADVTFKVYKTEEIWIWNVYSPSDLDISYI